MAGDASKLGARIKRLRKAGGLSQATLAELADTTTETIARTERGTNLPRTETLQRVASALGVSFAGIVGSEATPRKASKKDPPEVRAVVEELRGLHRGDLRTILATVRLAARGARLRPTRARST
ncbi:MAG: helix-turn-helix domain-containing protein [Polyangiales bacterium]